jgi:hypothetical protein
MTKLTRVITAGITSIVALGAFAAPSLAAEPTIEESMCETVGPLITTLGETIADATALVAPQATAVADAQAAMDASTATLGSTGLAFVKALDADGDVDATADAFVDAAGAFAEDVTEWVDAVDVQQANIVDTGLNQVVLDYYEGLCA